MESEDAVNTEPNYGHCRCCLEGGHHKDINKVYHFRGSKEVYADMFLDCFNVFLSTNMNLSTLICSSCVDLLRSAWDFKKLVVKTESQLMDALQNCDDEQMVLVNVPVSKETLDTTVGFKIQMSNHQPEFQLGSIDMGTETSQSHYMAEEQIPSHSASQEDCTEETPADFLDLPEDSMDSNLEDELQGSSGPGVERGTENVTESDEEFADLLGTEKGHKKRLKAQLRKHEKAAIIFNTTNLLEHCNATLFKSKMRAGFPCFYCRDIFDNFEVLRQHQTVEHSRNTISKALKTYTAESLVVYADVTDLKCLLCNLPMATLKEFKLHLVKEHDKKFYSKVTDRVIPYKLFENYFECQICTFNFETFGAIERHMNTHYRNYVCDVCGGGFVTVLRLKTHIYALHKEGKYPCEYCGKVFTTQLRHKGHVDFVHKNLKKLKCHKCSARFSDYFVQKKHMVDVHGESPIVYRCNVCFKSFNRRYTLSCHMKRHLEQRDVACDVCPYTCYNKTELREHLMKHNKHNMERIFRCSVCNKSYTRKKTLWEHMKIHTDDRRYVCQICEQAFVQSNSLRTHMRNHHKGCLSE